ncbi:Catenin alpha-3 [Fukomys damarensis]|uniref:Catenin alpha-3 n=1 Tax=Fukomys damarensis TaxID=885580 RepID=A0A091EMR4_FUKDA|nr:Catenin alpha-3 [Fukomys damarensis]
MSSQTPITLNIDPQDLQVQTFTVEKLLEPLIIQVTTLVNCPQNPSNRKKGRSKRARVLLASVEEATWNLLDKGEKIAQEATVLKEELTSTLGEVRKESEALKVSAERFTDDPCYLPKREAVVQAARALLAAVTRLLILADMIDVMCLLQHVSSFQRTLESLKNVSNKSDLQKAYQKLGKELENLDYLACKRQQVGVSIHLGGRDEHFRAPAVLPGRGTKTELLILNVQAVAMFNIEMNEHNVIIRAKESWIGCRRYGWLLKDY